MRRMPKGLIAVIIVVVLLIVLGSTAFGSYNNLVGYNEKVEGQKANIQTQLQRRADLIPNLVETVKGYAAHEEDIFTEISDARAKLAGGGSMSELANANDQLDGALNRLLMVVENYPDLKADQQYTALMDELAGTENRIAVARKDYNDAVQEYNGIIRRFPTVITANIFGFDKADYFTATDAAQSVPEVNFAG